MARGHVRRAVRVEVGRQPGASAAGPDGRSSSRRRPHASPDPRRSLEHREASSPTGRDADQRLSPARPALRTGCHCRASTSSRPRQPVRVGTDDDEHVSSARTPSARAINPPSRTVPPSLRAPRRRGFVPPRPWPRSGSRRSKGSPDEHARWAWNQSARRVEREDEVTAIGRRAATEAGLKIVQPSNPGMTAAGSDPVGRADSTAGERVAVVAGTEEPGGSWRSPTRPGSSPTSIGAVSTAAGAHEATSAARRAAATRLAAGRLIP